MLLYSMINIIKTFNNKYINNIVINMVNNLFNKNKTTPIPLGRWQLKNNDKNINLVDIENIYNSISIYFYKSLFSSALHKALLIITLSFIVLHM